MGGEEWGRGELVLQLGGEGRRTQDMHAVMLREMRSNIEMRI
jgi:hypothetical protein